MGEQSAISWTDATFNPWWGCTKVSPGCDNCYADEFDRRYGPSHFGKGVPRRVFVDADDRLHSGRPNVVIGRKHNVLDVAFDVKGRGNGLLVGFPLVTTAHSHEMQSERAVAA